MSRRVATFTAVAAFISIAAVVTIRTWKDVCIPGEPQAPLYGLHDFRDVLYYPAVATLDGVNPYDAANYLARYPVLRPLAPYSPATLLLHAPFALLPFMPAAWLHFALNVALVLVLAWLTLRTVGVPTTAAAVFGLGAFILLGRPAHMTLHIGQCTLYVVIGVYLALQYGRSRPWLAGIGLALACVKPTFGVPLGVVMLVRRDVRALAWGAAITAVALAVVGTALIAFAGGIGPVVASFGDAFGRLMQDSSANPASSILRIDTSAVISRFLAHPVHPVVEKAIAATILALGAWCIWTVADTRVDERRLLSSSVACLTTLTFSYHQVYDAVLLLLPMVALATATDGAPIMRVFGAGTRRVLLGLMAIPWVNYVATDTVVTSLKLDGDLWRAVASLNGVALSCAFAIAVAAVVRAASASAPAPDTEAPRISAVSSQPTVS